MSTRAEDAFRADIVEVGRRLYARGYVASNDGNISIRLDDNTILTTPKSVSKGFMTADMMVVVDLDGKKIRGTRDASSELLMHLEVYKNRPDARAVVHAHPPTATGFAVAGIPLDRAVLAEVVTTLGSIPIAEYGTPVHAGAAGGRAEVHQGVRRPAARQPWRADGRPRRVRRVLQDGNDRALREDQSRGAAARPRASAVARRSDEIAGFAR